MKLKNMTVLLLALCFTAGVLTGCGGSQGTGQQEEEPGADKKAILAVSFGTSYRDTLEANIASVENKIKDSFQDYEVRRAFTSDTIIKKLKERDNLDIDDPEQALQKLKDDGFTHVVVQPLHIIPGEEYDQVRDVVAKFEGQFEQLALGRPILHSKGGDGAPDDYAIAVEALKGQLPAMTEDAAVVFMGHGTHHEANEAYAHLQSVLGDTGFDNVFVGTVEASPSLDDVKEQLEAKGIKKVVLMPYMLVAGDHASNDMAGDEEDSWKTQLKQDGYEVEIYLHGLGENPAYQDIYVQHVRDAMAD